MNSLRKRTDEIRKNAIEPGPSLQPRQARRNSVEHRPLRIYWIRRSGFGLPPSAFPLSRGTGVPRYEVFEKIKKVSC